jgi:heavy metal-binding protein
MAVMAVLVWMTAAPVCPAGRQAPPAAAFVCPMHPDIVSRMPGTCPRCRMTLVPADPFDSREFLVDVAVQPAAPHSGVPVRLRLTVREPVTRAVVRDFVEVHEKRYHLFVVSQDLEYYDHVHPVQEADGSYVVDLTLPRAGYYKLFSDFLPLGGTPQVVPNVLVTADFAGDLASALPHLAADTALTRTAGGMRVSLSLPPDGLAAGRDEKLRYHVVDSETGDAVTDLEPYLAAFGHTLVLSEDTLHYVHAHPVELLPDGSGPVRGGPDLTFRALLPRPGRYRLWTQLKRRGVVSTVAFTLDVKSSAADQ